MPDPTMPKLMPPEAERELFEVLNWRVQPNPIDVYDRLREVLATLQAEAPKANTGKPRATGGGKSGANQ